jgi:TolB-like protein/DNA-binding winged helix-turn-helix (wHTH) protein
LNSLKNFNLGPWHVDALRGVLTGPENLTRHLEPKVMDVLVVLAEHANELVSREELLEAVWSGQVVSEERLTHVIADLRKAFNDDPGQPEYIETVPKRGYRLIARVHPVEENAATPAHIAYISRRKAGIIAVALLVLALVYVAFNEDAANSTPEDAVVGEKSIAVLPLVNLSGDPEVEFFSDGISEDVINLLAKVPDLKVIGRTSSFAFRGINEDLRTIGEKLGASTLLEGSVRKTDNRVRIVVQLIDASNGAHIWSDTYDRTVTDIFLVQSEIASSVVDALEIYVSPELIRHPPTSNSEAHTMFLKARIAANRLEWIEAAESLEAVVQIDPQFAEAYELLAYSYWYAAYNGMAMEEARTKTYEAASAAIAIDPSLIFAQVLRRSSEGGTSSELEASEWAYQQRPGNAMVLDSLVYLYTFVGYKEEAVRIARHYAEVDPLSLDANLDLFAALYSAGHLEEAMQTLDVVNEIGLGPSNWQWTVAGAKLAEGDDEAAIGYFEALLSLYDYQDSAWVRELVVAARDPIGGQAYLDRRIPEISASLSDDDDFDWRTGLSNWYLYFGFVDRYFELILAANPGFDVWPFTEEQLWHGHVFHRLGFTAHPDYLSLVTGLGIVDVWKKHGPPDFCRENGGGWTCE